LEYLQSVSKAVERPRPAPSFVTAAAPGVRLPKVDSLLITDIDNTLLGDDEALERLRKLIRENRGRLGFGVASGRALELVQEVLRGYDIKEIDVVIASVGSEIYYGPNYTPDKGWASALRSKWRPDKIKHALAALPFLSPQKGEHTQREFKISYDLDDTIDPQEALPLVHHALDEVHAAYSLIFSHGVFVDILPHRASKGKAIRYLTGKWNVPLERVATAGDSGNDRDMLLGQTAGIVVGNYDKELEPLRQAKYSRVYFADAHHADGIIEGLRHYDLLTAAPASLAG
jgi:sucrose-phosphate synthase